MGDANINSEVDNIINEEKAARENPQALQVLLTEINKIRGSQADKVMTELQNREGDDTLIQLKSGTNHSGDQLILKPNIYDSIHGKNNSSDKAIDPQTLGKQWEHDFESKNLGDPALAKALMSGYQRAITDGGNMDESAQAFVKALNDNIPAQGAGVRFEAIKGVAIPDSVGENSTNFRYVEMHYVQDGTDLCESKPFIAAESSIDKAANNIVDQLKSNKFNDHDFEKDCKFVFDKGTLGNSFQDLRAFKSLINQKIGYEAIKTDLNSFQDNFRAVTMTVKGKEIKLPIGEWGDEKHYPHPR